jgi:argininosuccinate synthase
MIKSVGVIETPELYDEGETQFVQVEFDDGTYVNLNEEELKNAAILAEKGCLHA